MLLARKEALRSPFQRFLRRTVGIIMGWKNWLIVERAKFLFTNGTAMIQLGRYFPTTFDGWRYQEPIHRPVVIFAQRDSIRRVVVSTLKKGNKVGSIDKREPGIRKLYAKAASSALPVVDF